MPSVSPEVWGFLLADFEKLMKSAFKLAEKGAGYTSPNPPVGAIIYKDGRVIARGYHKKAGRPHAEMEAIRKAGEIARDSTMVVTLEPCSHHGKTPPCVDAIKSAGIKRVVGAVVDKNPLVSGRGFKALEAAGIEVVRDVLQPKALEFYKPYFKFITTGLPFVTLKYAQSLDGRIATKSGDSRWISSDESLKLSHQLRAVNDSILIGNNTLKRDDPLLTTRLVKGPNPIRIVLSRSGKINLKRSLFIDKAAPTFVATPATTKEGKCENTISLSMKKGEIDLEDLLKRLGKMGIVSLLVEGGSSVLTSFIRQRQADRIVVCIAPGITGKGIEAIGELGIHKIGNSIRFENVQWRNSGPDMIMIGDPVWN
jgi:diaminohydroxyphosphoribosylaminopyrimidine deaminase/5-amino-6-(5-phosphoribosylamino)uracil reductase